MKKSYTSYKGYYIQNFDGRDDDSLKAVINGGVFLRNDGNWDLIYFDGTIYYIAINRDCNSGIFGSVRHYEKTFREKLNTRHFERC